MQELFPRSYAQTAEWLCRERTAYQDTLTRCQSQLQNLLDDDPMMSMLAASCQVCAYDWLQLLSRLDLFSTIYHMHAESLLACRQIQGRTKSLYSTMKKLLRLDDVAKGGRGRDEVYDLLGLRVIVAPLQGLSAEDGELAATQVRLICPLLLPKLCISNVQNIAGWQSEKTADGVQDP